MTGFVAWVALGLVVASVLLLVIGARLDREFDEPEDRRARGLLEERGWTRRR